MINKLSRFEFFYVPAWYWTPYNIGKVKVLRIGPIRVLVYERK